MAEQLLAGCCKGLAGADQCAISALQIEKQISPISKHVQTFLNIIYFTMTGMQVLTT